MTNRHRSKHRPRVGVTEMTSLLFCETQTALRFKHGKRVSPASTRASARGDREHERHDRNVRRYHRRPMAKSDRRCFIATAVYGSDSWQVDVLRGYRDSVLLGNRYGCWVVRMYYRLSPGVARGLDRSPLGRHLARRVLDRIVVRVSGGQGQPSE